MGSCWSCGASVDGLRYVCTCPACAGTALMKDIRAGVESQAGAMQMIAAGLSNVAGAVTSGLSQISGELSTLAGIVQGGFDEVNWELQQQTQVLLSIDQTLKTPSQTQAREWREMAEKLRHRGCFDDAEQWFLKSIQSNPLDFRTYVGLAMNFVRKDDFDKAEEVLTRSLPHAPKCKKTVPMKDMSDAVFVAWPPEGDDGKEAVQQPFDFDYRSLAHRLIGRIYACRDNYGRAAVELRTAIDLSPDYPEGNYDYALYCVQSGKGSGWDAPLRVAIAARPDYLNVAMAERRFSPVRQEVTTFLSGLVDEAYLSAGQSTNDAETQFADARSAVARSPVPAAFEAQIAEAASILATAKCDCASMDYLKMLRVPADAARVATLSSSLLKKARESSNAFADGQERRQSEARQAIINSTRGGLIPGLLTGLLLGSCFFIGDSDHTGSWFLIGFLPCLVVGVVVGVIVGAVRYMCALKGTS